MADKLDKIEVSRSLMDRRNRMPGFFGPNDGRFKPPRDLLDSALEIVCSFDGWLDNEWFRLGEDAVLNIYRIPSAGICAATIHPASKGEGGKMVINYWVWNHIIMIEMKKKSSVSQFAR